MSHDKRLKDALRIGRVESYDGRDLVLAGERGVMPVHLAAEQLGMPAPDSWQVFLESASVGIPALRALAKRLDEVDEGWEDESSAWFAPVTDRPEKIICIGLNYRRHAEETGKQVPPEPMVFGKFGNALAGHQDYLRVRQGSKLDYEAELGVVIGETTRNVGVQYALESVLGYCNVNDLSDRALQYRTSQFLLGKTPDGYLPCGPWLVIPPPGYHPQNLRIRSWLNGEMRQNSSTADMIFSVAEIIAYLSRYMTLEAGDIIATGTPEGVIHGHVDPRWMKGGDEVCVEIEGLGRLKTTVVEEETPED